MNINGIELEFDVMDAEMAGRYEQAQKVFEEEAERIQKGSVSSLKEVIEEQCYTVFDFFNTVFGDGTDREIFGDRTNLRECVKAYMQVTEEVGRQKDELAELLPGLDDKTIPMNRKQKRAAERKK